MDERKGIDPLDLAPIMFIVGQLAGKINGFKPRGGIFSDGDIKRLDELEDKVEELRKELEALLK